MRSTAAARRYGRALYSLAGEQGDLAEVRRELADLAELFDQRQDLRDAVLTPLHPVAERRASVDALSQRLGASTVVRNFISFLVDRRRLIDFSAIRAEYERLCDEASGRTRAEVVCAGPLDDERRQRLQQVLSRRTGGEVVLDIRVDPTLIGGAVAKVGDVVYDGSLRTQLAQLRANLTKGS